MIQRALALLLLLPLSLAAQEPSNPDVESFVQLRRELDAPHVPTLRAPALGARLTEGPRLEVDPASGFATLFDVDLPAREDGTLELRRAHGVFRTAPGHFGRGCRTDLDARVRLYGRFAVVDRPEGFTLFVATVEDRWQSLVGPEVEVLVREPAGGFTVAATERTWRFDAEGRLTELDPGFRVERAPRRLRLRSQDHDEELVLELDAADRVVRARRGAEAVTYAYDHDGRLASVTGATTRTLRHDAEGRLAALETPEGKLALTHDRERRITSLERGAWRQTYRHTRRPLTELVGLRQVSVETPEGTWSYTREKDGWTIHGPDGPTRLWEDERARVVSRRLPDGRVESIAWDEHGRPTPAGREASTLPGGAPLQTTASDDGSTTTLEGDGARETVERDTAGRVVARTTPDGRTTRFEHDARGFVVARVAPAGRTVYQRDEIGRAVRVTTPAGRTFTYRFEQNRLVARDGPAGARTIDVSASGRRTLIVGPGEKRLVLEADFTALRVDAEDDQDVATWLVSDEQGRIVEQGDAGGVRRLTWGADGFPATLETNGVTLRWTRTPTSQRVETPWGAFERAMFAKSERVTSLAGRFEAELGSTAQPIRVRASNGVVTTLVHDALGRTTSRTVKGPDGKTLLALEDVWSERHERALRRRDGVETGYEHDAAGRLAGASRPGRVARWSYEADGHRTAAVQDGATTTVALDARGCPTTLSGPQGDTRLTWDAAGRLVRRERAGRVDRLTWSSRDQLVKVERAGGPTVTYTYDGAGLPRTRTTNGATTTYVHDTARRLLAEVGPDGAARVWTWGTFGIAPLAVTAGGVTTTLHADDLGHVLAYTDAQGQLVGRAAFDPWGEVELDPGVGLPLVLAGSLVDREAGLVRFGARWYDPSLGQFLSPDPLDLEGGVNPWLYAEASPLDLIDPSGWFGIPGWRVEQERAMRRLEIQLGYAIEDAGGRPMPTFEFNGHQDVAVHHQRRADRVTVTNDRLLSPSGAPVVVRVAKPPREEGALLRSMAAQDKAGPRYRSVSDKLAAAGEAVWNHVQRAREIATRDGDGGWTNGAIFLTEVVPDFDLDQDRAAHRFADGFMEALPPVMLARGAVAAFEGEARIERALAKLSRKDISPELRGLLRHELDQAREQYEGGLVDLALATAESATLLSLGNEAASLLRAARPTEALAQSGARQAARGASSVATELAESDGRALARANRAAAREAAPPSKGLAQVVDPDAELGAAARGTGTGAPVAKPFSRKDVSALLTASEGRPVPGVRKPGHAGKHVPLKGEDPALLAAANRQKPINTVYAELKHAEQDIRDVMNAHRSQLDALTPGGPALEIENFKLAAHREGHRSTLGGTAQQYLFDTIEIAKFQRMADGSLHIQTFVPKNVP